MSHEQCSGREVSHVAMHMRSPVFVLFFFFFGLAMQLAGS